MNQNTQILKKIIFACLLTIFFFGFSDFNELSNNTAIAQSGAIDRRPESPTTQIPAQNNEMRVSNITAPQIIQTNNANTTVSIPTVNLNDQSGARRMLANIVLPQIATVIIGLASGLSLFFVIFSGIQMLTAYGKNEQYEKAKKTLIYAIVGLLMAILSYGIVAIIATL